MLTGCDRAIIVVRVNAESGKRYSPDSHATLGTRSLNLLAFCDQNMSKSSPTDENIAQLAEQALRRYLIRCHRTVSDEYPEIKNIEPVGHYAVALVFSDGHDSGIYSWDYLHDLGRHQEAYWKAYLMRMEQAGASREPKTLA